jgi:hypothetical protein
LAVLRITLFDLADYPMRFSFIQAAQAPITLATNSIRQRDQQLIQKVAWLFRDSLAQVEAGANRQPNVRSEQQKWQPVLRDAHGNVVQRATPILLNPIVADDLQRAQPTVQWVLPYPSGRKAIGQPRVLLERRPLVDHAEQATRLIDSFLRQHPASTNMDGRGAVAQYNLLLAATDPTRLQDFRRGLAYFVSSLTSHHRETSEELIQNLLRLHPIYRTTLHPDIGAVGRQRIEQAAIPLSYKGVLLQPRQVRNLLLGNTIEVTGIRDPHRHGLYRAGVTFNILNGKAEENARREELKTDNKQEALYHQRTVHQQHADGLRDNDQWQGGTNRERTQRPH